MSSTVLRTKRGTSKKDTTLQPAKQGTILTLATCNAGDENAVTDG